MRRLQIILLTIIAFVGFIPVGNVSASASAEEIQQEIDRLQSEIEAIKKERENLQQQIDSNNYKIYGYSTEVSKLYGEAEILQKEVQELQMSITKLEKNIKTLESEVKDIEADISEKEENITNLEIESRKRLKSSYYNFRVYGTVDKTTMSAFSDGINEYFKDSQYKEIAQNTSDNIVTKLMNLKLELNKQKIALANKMESIKEEREVLVIKQVDVKKKNDDLEAKIGKFQSEIHSLKGNVSISSSKVRELNETHSQLEADYLLYRQMQFQLDMPGNGVFVRAGTIIGFQGNTGYVWPAPTDPNSLSGTHLHFIVYVRSGNGFIVDNPCNYLQPGNGCGVSGGRLQIPIRSSSVVLTQGFKGAWIHDGIDIVGFPLEGTPVYAAHDGYLTRGQDCWHANGGYPVNPFIPCANYAIIEGSDIKTGYWHLK